MSAMTGRVTGALACAALLAHCPAAATAAGPPRAAALTNGWEVRDEAGDPAKAQPAPPEESAEDESSGAPVITPGQDPSQSLRWRGAKVPSVFNARVDPDAYPGERRRYRLIFTGPQAPSGFSWLIAFDEVRRAAGVYLNGRRIGGDRDGYTPFSLPASGLRPGRRNELVVKVDNRKNPHLLEGWWNWGGIVRPVHLVPVGRAHVRDLGTMSKVACKGPARRCRASLLLDGVLERRRAALVDPVLTATLRTPGGRVIKRSFRLGSQRGNRRRFRVSMPVPAPRLWSPDHPTLYSARFTLRDRGQVQQVVRRSVGMRTMKVKRGMLYLNNRRVLLRGASIHEDMPGNGAALAAGDMDTIVSNLQELGANVTRAHYLLNDRLLSRLDRAGIMVWNQAPIWERDHGSNLLKTRSQRARRCIRPGLGTNR
jgi:beta-galactosidase/beta-glucuronidase